MNLRSLGLVIGLACVCAVPGYAKAPKLPPLVLKSTDHQGLKYPLVGRFTVIPDKHFDATIVRSQSASGATIPLWSRTLGSGYTYQMVGRNPFVALSAQNQNTSISAVVIPVRFTFTSYGNTVFDPTQADATCLAGKTAAGLLAASPLFNSIVGYPGGTYVGTGEYVDLFQRANYFSQTNPNGLNPNYHVHLGRKQVAKLSIPVNGGEVAGGTCGNIGLIEFNSWDAYVQNTIMPMLASQNVAPPTTLPIFLFYNVVLYQGNTSNCCVLGYHSAFSDPAYGNAFHTYSVAGFSSSQSFTGVSDISSMSHEIAEWMDDPSGNNPTPSWGNIGQVSGCQANLEVGDPLSGTLTQIYMPSNGYTYHVQDLAFTSWFYHQNPSTGVNGWYSFLGNFLAPAAPC